MGEVAVVDVAIAKTQNEDGLRQSEKWHQFRAFSHLTIPVGDGYIPMPLQAETTFKPLVDAYGIALRDYVPDNEGRFNDNNLYRAYSTLFEQVYAFDFGDHFKRISVDPMLTRIKLGYFKNTIAVRKQYTDFKVHPENNAWLPITYTMRLFVTEFDDDVVSVFKMFPLLEGSSARPREGWVQLASNAQFLCCQFEFEFGETLKAIGWATFIVMKPFSGNIVYPVMFVSSGEVYIKVAEAIFYDFATP
jgi:hypothetical protein